jgi:hypothetical protein
VNEILNRVSKDLELYTGDRRKTVLLVYKTLIDLSITTIDLNELNEIIDSSNEELNIKRDAIKMVRVFNNILTISKEEKLANELYLKDVRKKSH